MLGSALGSILGRLLPKLVKIASPILKNVVAPLGLSAAMFGIDGAIQKRNTWLWSFFKLCSTNNCKIF